MQWITEFGGNRCTKKSINYFTTYTYWFSVKSKPEYYITYIALRLYKGICYAQQEGGEFSLGSLFRFLKGAPQPSKLTLTALLAVLPGGCKHESDIAREVTDPYSTSAPPAVRSSLGHVSWAAPSFCKESVQQVPTLSPYKLRRARVLLTIYAERKTRTRHSHLPAENLSTPPFKQTLASQPPSFLGRGHMQDY